jgi:hypothetical protein
VFIQFRDGAAKILFYAFPNLGMRVVEYEPDKVYPASRNRKNLIVSF